MLKTLRRKFILITTAFVTIVLLIVLFGITSYYAASLRQESYRLLEMAVSRPPGDHMPRYQIGDPIPDGFNPTPMFVVTISADGTATLQDSNTIEIDEDQLTAILAQVEAIGSDRGELTDTDLRYVVQVRDNETKIAFESLSLEKSRVLTIFLLTASAVAFALLLFFVATVFLAKWALKPVDRAWQKQRQFVANASHELKTPLTVILANLAILKRSEDRITDSQVSWLQNTEEEATRMRTLVDDLLFLAKGDDAMEHPSSSKERINLSDVVSTTVLSFEALAYENSIELDANIQAGLELEGNEQHIKQLTGILLDNAIKYSDKNQAVQLGLKRQGNEAILTVYNQGTALGQDELSHLFDRFYRSDPSRSQPGYGLGLAIAKSITDQHRGKIMVQNSAGGILFTVFLPL